MAKLTPDEVKHVAKLSNLNLKDTEIKKFTPQLEKIIEYIGQLQEIDTKGVEPTSQTTGLTNIVRDDTLTNSEELIINDYYKVEQILKNRTNE